MKQEGKKRPPHKLLVLLLLLRYWSTCVSYVVDLALHPYRASNETVVGLLVAPGAVSVSFSPAGTGTGHWSRPRLAQALGLRCVPQKKAPQDLGAVCANECGPAEQRRTSSSNFPPRDAAAVARGAVVWRVGTAVQRSRNQAPVLHVPLWTVCG